jgi:hypothetical protein
MKTFVILIISIVIMVLVQKVQDETSLAAISFSVLSGIGAFAFMHDKLVRGIK